jgi:hypothetical protein
MQATIAGISRVMQAWRHCRAAAAGLDLLENRRRCPGAPSARALLLQLVLALLLLKLPFAKELFLALNDVCRHRKSHPGRERRSCSATWAAGRRLSR